MIHVHAEAEKSTNSVTGRIKVETMGFQTCSVRDGVRENGKEEQEGLTPSNSRGLTDIIFVISQKKIITGWS